MEVVVKTNPQTTTATVEKNGEPILSEPLQPALFLLFAEYLGYVTPSPYIEWCEEFCTNGTLPTTKKDIIKTVAINTFDLMKVDFSLDEIRNKYKIFYDLAIRKWEYKYLEATRK